MKPALQKILGSIVTGLILPLLLYRFGVTPWSDPIRYWVVVLMSFAISFLVYKYRKADEERISLKTHLVNFVISFVVLCIIALVYTLILAILYSLIGVDENRT